MGTLLSAPAEKAAFRCAGVSTLVLEKLMHDCGYKIGWDGKTNAISGCFGFCIDGGQCGDANEFTLQVD